MKRIFKLLMLGSLTLSLASCESQNAVVTGGKVDVTHLGQIEEPEFYTNKFDEEKIPDQWSAYGVGDPFVYRFNGRYYLYCSTKNFEVGVRGWVSDDLIHYEPITGEGLDPGYVSNDPCTLGAYAPEVIYKDGYFYMVQSQSGNGHYILRSDKPEGPFVQVKDNFGESIDGSFFIDDDEQMYLLRASNTGIRIIKMEDDLSIGASRTLDNTVLGGWTEGPYLLKRDGTYYLTYTGNHVTSEGYRIAYSYSNDQVFSRDAFTEGGTIVLNTDADFKGLGHSSTVLGPDLDSYYLAYHNLNSSGGPNRSNNISRLSFSGTEMIVEHAELENNIMPNMPDFSTRDENGFVIENNKYLTTTETATTYSAEYNFIGNDVSMICSYVDDNNYYFININNDLLSLNSVTNGQTKVVAETEFVKDYDYNKLHTVRIAYKDGKVIVYFDNMNKISLEDCNMPAGKIGYINSEGLEINYTAYSDVAHGSSDNKVVHQNTVLASNYCHNNFSKSTLALTTGEEQEDFNGTYYSYDVKFNSVGDYATYKVYALKDGTYGVDLTVTKDSEGKKVVIQVDNNDPIRMTIPTSNDSYGTYYKTTIGDIELSKGAHYITIIAEDDIQYHDLSYFLSSDSYPKYEHDLSDYVTTGVKYVTTWKINNDGHYALAGNRNLMYFGDETLTDYKVEVDIELVGDTKA